MLFVLETISKYRCQIFKWQADPSMQGINDQTPFIEFGQNPNFSIDEIVTEIIGTDENIFGLLEAIHSNTPKDSITYWGRHQKLLLETVGNHPKNNDDLCHDHY